METKSVPELQHPPKEINIANHTFTSFIMKKSDQRRDMMMNPIDSCWRSNPDWETNRRSLADCGFGFGQNAMGGRNSEIYLVTREEPLWIVFQRDLVITLKKELMIRSHKTVDGRGVRVEITRGPCIEIENVKHAIIHGISIHDCRRRVGLVQITPTLASRGKAGCSEDEQECGGDAINIKNSSHLDRSLLSIQLCRWAY
ncbi:OLC1v1020358C1 [Oldenlandia corymbosa var. corymbosa]|uniref:OLC1v1020358C1 n=1 Tax=Oldenlandia corymbosa var. corymbosa TaxID=529605 RepID=A0AAV1EGI0_OLDCO|nr:OLC1v1020358C1 [Oldenlandia corymbosa var. corymbosa]